MPSIQVTIKVIVSVMLGLCLPAFADNVTENWSWGVGCPGDGASFSTAYFNASSASGFQGVGNCTRTSTHFTQFTFNSDNSGGGTTLNSTTLYGVHTSDWLIIPPTLSYETEPVYTVNMACPYTNKNLNWAVVQWDTGIRDLDTTHTYVIGTATYSTTSGITVNYQYDVYGGPFYMSPIVMGGTCASGSLTVSGNPLGADLNGTAYLSVNGAGVFKTNAGHATFFLPVYTINPSSDFASQSFEGMLFDSYQASDSESVAVTSDATGTIFTVQIYTNPGTGSTAGAPFTDTIQISQSNYPQNGMFTATVNRTGVGGPSASPLACIANRTIDTTIICTGSSPASPTYPYTLAFAIDGAYVLGQASSSSVAGVEESFDTPHGAYSDGTRLYVADYTNNRVLIWNSIPTSDLQPANVVLGQPTMDSYGANTGGISAMSLDGPTSVFAYGTQLFVSDYTNNRVLIWNGIPTQTDEPASIVLGQATMTTGTAGGTAATSMKQPYSVMTDGTRLLVTDQGRNRVLIWNTIPSTNDAAASIEIGQASMAAAAATSTASGLNAPTSAWSDGTNIYVSENTNNRVLIFNGMPSANQPTANVVLGQPDFTSNTANNGGVGASTLDKPYYVSVNGTNLYVADYTNNRVLVWTTIPTVTQTPANIVLGQQNMNLTTAGGVTATSMKNPASVMTDGTNLYVADYTYNRIDIFNAAVPTTDAAATVTLGQPSATQSTANETHFAATAQNFFKVAGINTDGTRLFVADTSNNRVLIWNSLPRTDDQAPNIVLGQPNFTTIATGKTASSLNAPGALNSDGTRLFVADSGNNRVLIWSTIPTVTRQPANLVLGQPAFGVSTANNGGVGASTLDGPQGVSSDGTHLFVADLTNNRVLMWNSIPTVTQTPASQVLGQSGFSGTSANNGGVGATTMSGPSDVQTDGTHVIVPDQGNNRVLIWNEIPTENQQPADVELGQPDFTSTTAQAVSATSLSSPQGAYSDGTRLYIDDQTYNRVLLWNTFPTTNGQAANIVLGQPDLVSKTANNGGVSSGALNTPGNVAGTGSLIFISDGGNNRVITIPAP